uniref:Zinc finger and BTB domain containing 4 n=1 Tax=Sparus aurata TaxID=8175 RepID=A0A671VTL2_SPAAU
MADGPKNAKITLSFPLSAAPLPASLTSPNHCRNSSSSSPSPHRRRPSSKSSDEASLWKLDATMDVKHRPFKPPRHDSSPSSSPSSSSSPMTVHALIRKDIKSPPPLKCSRLNTETQFHRSPPRSSSGSLGGGYSSDGWDERHRLANGTASPSQTAQILFSLGTSAYQRGGDAERREKITGRPAGKVGSPHGPSLHPPTLHLPPPLPPPPPPPSEGLTAPPHSSSYSPTDSLKPELICGVCHRLFSSASSLTVHMRLHRGSRALSCRYCGKVFIHSKRLQSHEAACRVPTRSLLARIQGDDAAATEILEGDEHHFVKVVDGNVIYFCSVCERSYMTLSSLKRHSNVHSWRRRYPCHYCDKVFALAEYRTKHEVWHTGERRYQCIFCWDAFATYYNLKTHQKAIHGINPSLISSEKTANGGYKQKANALKLYRLLPMRSQKRPYKTYSSGSFKMSSSSKTKTPKSGRGAETGMPSVITYGHTKPSVIVHGTAVSSSVIVHSNQVTSGSEKSPLNSPSPDNSSSQTSHKGSPRPIKTQRDSSDSHRKRSRDSSDTTEERSGGRQDAETGRLFHKSRKSHSKSEISSSKQLSASVGSQVKEAGPLCQITVRIGEEAIVKRSISETDLRRDKSLSPPKTKRCETSSVREDEEEEDGKIVEEKNKDAEEPVKEARHDLAAPPLPSPKPPVSTSVAPTGIKRRPWTNGNAAECGTCGRWFSSPRKRDKHELSHLLEFVCLFCRATFPSRDKLEAHQRAHNSSPSRLSRRALSRHTCPQCHKVCKTSSALTRHIRRHEHTPKSPCRSPSTIGLLAHANRQVHSTSQGLDRLTLPTGAAGAGDRPSAHALLLPRAPQPPEPEHQDTVSSRDSQQGDTTPVGYPSQNYPLPLIVPDSYRSGKKQEDNLLMSSYPAGALPFGPLGKMMVPNGGDLAKLPFYPDPYQLLYGPQLLAYPYNLAALPVALNMMAPGGDKVEPLPFLPAIFNYAAAAGPYMGAAPHPLVANPSLYSSGSGSRAKKRGEGLIL